MNLCLRHRLQIRPVLPAQWAPVFFLGAGGFKRPVLETYVHPEPRLRMRRATSPLRHTFRDWVQGRNAFLIAWIICKCEVVFVLCYFVWVKGITGPLSSLVILA
jgi:hypothetical protein